MDITKDSKAVLFLLWREYKRRRNAGQPRLQACSFSDSRAIRDLLAPDMDADDLLAALWELKNAGYVDGLNADNDLINCALTDAAISALEKLPLETVKTVADFIGNFIP